MKEQRHPLTEKELRQEFDNHFDCYADTTDESVVLAMTQDRFVELVTRLFPDNIQKEKP